MSAVALIGPYGGRGDCVMCLTPLRSKPIDTLGCNHSNHKECMIQTIRHGRLTCAECSREIKSPAWAVAEVNYFRLLRAVENDSVENVQAILNDRATDVTICDDTVLGNAIIRGIDAIVRMLVDASAPSSTYTLTLAIVFNVSFDTFEFMMARGAKDTSGSVLNVAIMTGAPIDYARRLINHTRYPSTASLYTAFCSASRRNYRNLAIEIVTKATYAQRKTIFISEVNRESPIDYYVGCLEDVGVLDATMDGVIAQCEGLGTTLAANVCDRALAVKAARGRSG